MCDFSSSFSTSSSFQLSLLPLSSSPKLVIESCKQGIIGTFPALNARNDDILDDWLSEIRKELSVTPSPPQTAPHFGPFGVNLIVHKTNPRLGENLKRIGKLLFWFSLSLSLSLSLSSLPLSLSLTLSWLCCSSHVFLFVFSQSETPSTSCHYFSRSS
jgi:hypothetical protein